MNIPGLNILNGTMHAALERAREATSSDLPHDRILRFEEVLEARVHRDQADENDRYRALQWVTGLRGFFRYLIADGIEPHAILPQLWSVGQNYHVDGFELRPADAKRMMCTSAKAVWWKVRLIYPVRSLDRRMAELALAAFVARTHYSVEREDLRFDQMLHAELDGLENPPGSDEMTMRREAVVLILRYLTWDIRPGASLCQRARRVMRELWTIGRGLHQAPFRTMTMEESGGMLAETKANHSYRGKRLSALIERAGMKGSRLPGQKNKHASASYRVVAQRTCNRRKEAA